MTRPQSRSDSFLIILILRKTASFLRESLWLLKRGTRQIGFDVE